jgi:hypothetical protein
MSSAPFAVMTGGAFEAWTVTDAALLGAGFGSRVVDVTLAEAVMPRPSCVEQSASKAVSVNVAVAPTGSDGLVHCTGPLPPTAGWLQFQPAGTVSDWNTVWAGTAVVSDTLAAGRSSSVGLNDAVSVSALLSP